MTPTQAPFSVNTSSSTLPQNKCYCGEGASSSHLLVPIIQKGLFFQDSFFEQAHAQFEAAVRQVLSRWGETPLLAHRWPDTNLCLSNIFNLYRELRAAILKEETQAISVGSNDTSQKIVIDVKEFIEGGIKVKVVDKEVVVEGHLANSHHGDPLTSSKCFKRHFSLPDSSSMMDVSAVMSSDGILTIITPKLMDYKTDVTQRKLNLDRPNTIRSGISTEASSASDKTLSAIKSLYKSDDLSQSEEYCLQPPAIAHPKDKEGIKVPIRISTSLRSTENPSIKNQSCQNEVCIPFATQQKKSTVQEGIKTKGNASCMQDEKHISKSTFKSDVKKPEGSTASKYSSDSKGGNEISNLQSQIQTISPVYAKIQQVPVTVPIIRRGSFFSDSIFESVRNHFERAVKDVLSEWGEGSSTVSDLTSYRNLRSRDLREENQAFKSIEDELSHKLILDVHDFLNGGDVSVNAVSSRELEIKGHVEKQEGDSKSTKRFLHRFAPPGNRKLEVVSPVISSDGILTITVPKKIPTTLEQKEFIIPINIEEEEHKRQPLMIPSVTKEEKEISKKRSEDLPRVRCWKATGEIQNRTHESCESSASEEIVDVMPSASNNSSLQEEKASHLGAAESVQSVSTDKMKQNSQHRIPLQLEVTGQTDIVEGIKQLKTDKKYNKVPPSSEGIHHFDKIIKNEEVLQKNKISRKSEKDKETMSQSDSVAHHCKEVSSETAKMISRESLSSNSVTSKCLSANKMTKILSSKGTSVTITRKGLFFSDSFFNDFHKDFEAAIQEVLDKFCDRSSQEDDLTSYRSLRQRNLKSETQAFHINDSRHSHKILVDVRDFLDGDITITVNEGKEVVIEGHSQRTEGILLSGRSFRRRFSIPATVDANAITSAMSSDGVLVVISPKREMPCGNKDTSEVSS